MQKGQICILSDWHSAQPIINICEHEDGRTDGRMDRWMDVWVQDNSGSWEWDGLKLNLTAFPTPPGHLHGPYHYKELAVPPARESRTLLPPALIGHREAQVTCGGHQLQTEAEQMHWAPLMQHRKHSPGVRPWTLSPGPTLLGCSGKPARPCLLSCRFSSNSIGDGGAEALAKALKVNQGLESLE